MAKSTKASDNGKVTQLPVATKTRPDLARRGLTEDQFAVLRDVVFGHPDPRIADLIDNFILVAIDYCAARKLDIFKKPIAIVPMYDKKQDRYVPTIWGTIQELRTTAARTREHAGKDEPEFGPVVLGQFGKEEVSVGKGKSKQVDVAFDYPEWCKVTVYRMVAGERCAFTGIVYWGEAYARIGWSAIPNRIWRGRPFGQMAKCAEAEALRAAFPEEWSGPTAEEMSGQIIEGEAIPPRPRIEDQTDKGKEAVWELITSDGEVLPFTDGGALAEFWTNLLQTPAFLNCSSDELRGHWETNAPMWDQLVQEKVGSGEGADPWGQVVEDMYDGALGRVLVREMKESAAAAKPQAEGKAKKAEKTQASNSGPPPSPVHDGGAWKDWVPWFKNQVQEMPEDERQQFVGSYQDELKAMSEATSPAGKGNYTRLTKALSDLGVTVDVEVEY